MPYVDSKEHGHFFPWAWALTRARLILHEDNRYIPGLRRFVEDVIGLRAPGPVFNRFTINRDEDYHRIKAWLIAMGEIKWYSWEMFTENTMSISK